MQEHGAMITQRIGRESPILFTREEKEERGHLTATSFHAEWEFLQGYDTGGRGERGSGTFDLRRMRHPDGQWVYRHQIRISFKLYEAQGGGWEGRNLQED